MRKFIKFSSKEIDEKKEILTKNISETKSQENRVKEIFRNNFKNNKTINKIHDIQIAKMNDVILSEKKNFNLNNHINNSNINPNELNYKVIDIKKDIDNGVCSNLNNNKNEKTKNNEKAYNKNELKELNNFKIIDEKGPVDTIIKNNKNKSKFPVDNNINKNKNNNLKHKTNNLSFNNKDEKNVKKNNEKRNYSNIKIKNKNNSNIENKNINNTANKNNYNENRIIKGKNIKKIINNITTENNNNNNTFINNVNNNKDKINSNINLNKKFNSNYKNKESIAQNLINNLDNNEKNNQKLNSGSAKKNLSKSLNFNNNIKTNNNIDNDRNKIKSNNINININQDLFDKYNNNNNLLKSMDYKIIYYNNSNNGSNNANNNTNQVIINNIKNNINNNLDNNHKNNYIINTNIKNNIKNYNLDHKIIIENKSDNNINNLIIQNNNMANSPNKILLGHNLYNNLSKSTDFDIIKNANNINYNIINNRNNNIYNNNLNNKFNNKEIRNNNINQNLKTNINGHPQDNIIKKNNMPKDSINNAQNINNNIIGHKNNINSVKNIIINSNINKGNNKVLIQKEKSKISKASNITKLKKYFSLMEKEKDKKIKRRTSFDCRQSKNHFKLFNSQDIEVKTFDSNYYKIIKPIGKGTYGEIYLVQDPKTLVLFALKKIIIGDALELRDNQEEYKLTWRLTHSNPELKIAKKFAIEIKKLDKYNLVMYILMEAANCDWEHELLNRQKVKAFYTEIELITILKSLVNTFAILQKKGISHRDVKPQNILCFGNEGYKLSDFGEAKSRINQNGIKNLYGFEQNTTKQTVRGTELYMSPILFRALRTKSLEGVQYNSYKSDVFSLGMCFLLASSLNYQSLFEIREVLDIKIIEIVVNKYLGRLYSKNYINLLINMLQIDEKLRPDFIQLSNILGLLN